MSGTMVPVTVLPRGRPFTVDDLDAILARLAAEGVTVDPKREEGEFGRFAWITDPEGNRIELWEPPAGR